MANEFIIRKGFKSLSDSEITGSLSVTAGITGSLQGTASYAVTAISASYFSGSISTAVSAISASYAATASYIDGVIYNIVTVGKSGSNNVDYYSIKDAVDSIVSASENNPYLVQVYPGTFIENTITMKSWITVKGDSSISTIVSASNASQSLFVGADQSMISDLQIQGVTAPSASAVVYSSPTTPQTNAIFYVENVRFGTNYTHAKVVGTSGGNCIMQCSNVKYGGYPFTLGFYVTNDGSGIGRMQLRNVTSTNGGISTTTDLIFAKADQPGCTFIVNGCLLTKAVGSAAGTGFWVENGGSLRLTAVNFQRWATGIYAPNTGSAPSIFGSALNFENNTTDVLIEHPTATGKIEGTDSFLKTIIPVDAPLYEVNQDPRRLTVAKKGGDFTSVSASVAYITGSSATNRYVIDIGPGQFTEKQIDLRNKPYVSVVGSNIQTTQIVASGSGNYDQILLGPTNEISFLSINGVNNPGYAAIKVDGTGDDFAQAHKISIYDFDYGIKVFSSVSSSTFYGEYIDINGAFSYGTYVSSSNTTASIASIENYYLFPSGGVSVGNYAAGLGAELDLYTCLFVGDRVSGSTSLYLADGAVAEVAGFDAQNWEYGVRVPNIGNPPTFRMVGAMIHNTITSDFLIQQPSTRGRFQGIADHSKINNASPDFYWNFLDDTDGENDVTRKLSVTFEDGTHTDATTLIFNGSAMGVLNRGEISVVSGLTASVSGGFGYVQVPSTEIYKRLDWPDTQIILPSSSNNYIYFNDNKDLLYAGTSPNYLTNIVLGRVVTNQTGIAFIDQSPYLGAHTANLLSTFNRQALGPVYADGSIVTLNAATSYSIDITAGNYFYSENQFLPTGGTGKTFARYYISGSGWNTTNTATIPSNVYNSGSSLIAMSSSYFTKHTLYLVGQGIEEQYLLVVGQNQYATLIETENANLPTPPTYFSDGVVGIASIYIQSGSSNVTQIEDIRPVIGFKASGVNASSVHGNLLGLGADDHTQYLLVNGGRQMTADLGLGGNDIYNVDLITANSVSASFTGSLIGTSSWANNSVSSSYAQSSLSSSYALTASYALNGGGSSTPTFPYTGSAIISGSLNVTGSVRISSGNLLIVSSSLNGIGLGDTLPTASLHIRGNSNTTGSSLIIQNSGSVTNFEVLNSSQSNIRIGVNNITTEVRGGSGSEPILRVLRDLSGTSGLSISHTTGVPELTTIASSAGLQIVSADNTLVTIGNQSLLRTQIQNLSQTYSALATDYGLFIGSSRSGIRFGDSIGGGFGKVPYLMQVVSNNQSEAGDLKINPFGGNIGIGLASTYTVVPNAKLHVKGESDTVGSAFRVESLNNTRVIIGNDGYHGLNTSTLGTTGLTVEHPYPSPANYFIVDFKQATTRFTLDTDGRLVWVAGKFTTYDDNSIISTFRAPSTNTPEIRFSAAGNLHFFYGTRSAKIGRRVETAQGRLWYYADINGGGLAGDPMHLFESNATPGTSVGATTQFLQLRPAGITDTGTAVNSFKWLDMITSSSIDLNNPNTTLFGIDYNPTITSYNGRHFGILIRPSTLSGFGLGSTLPSASLHIRGGSTGSLLILESNTSSSIFTINNNGSGSFNGFLTATGSLIGTSSWANNAVSASYILQAVSSSFATTAQTASFVTTAQTASFVQTAQTASYVLQAISSSFASTASFSPNYLPLTGGTINGDVVLNGTASIAYLNVSIESASVIYSSGSNQFGDATNDVQTLIGRVVVSGSLQTTGSLNVTGGITGSLFGSSSYALTASYALNGGGSSAPTFPYTGSAIISGSLTVDGSGSFRASQSNAVLSLTDATTNNSAVFSIETPIGGSPQLELTTDRFVVNGITRLGALEFPTGFDIVSSTFEVRGSNDLFLQTDILDINVIHGGRVKPTEINSYPGYDLYLNPTGSNNNGGTGNVLIGNPPASPAFKLNVSGSGKFIGDLTVHGNNIIASGSGFSGLSAGENLAAGDFVNIYSGGVRKASNNDTTKQAHGFVIDTVSAGANVTVYYSGLNTAITGLTAGGRYFLGTTGGETLTPPTAAGQLSQEIGVAISTTAILVNFGPAIVT